MKYVRFITVLILLCFYSCQVNQNQKHFSEINKVSESDPFKNSVVESEYFEVDTKQNNVVEGKNGTVVFIPPGAFVDQSGNRVDGKVSVELAQPNSLSDIILSNLTTTYNGAPLSSAGMLYVNANIDGKPVFINPDNPLYTEVASDAEREDMMLYYGERSNDGKMNWVDPKPLEKWLVPVDLDLLNFYPPGFEQQVESGMPFRHYTTATTELKDSLYYSLASMAEEITDKEEHDSIVADEHSHKYNSDCNVISPASIKVLKEKRFQNTLISTREFEKRLQVIFGTCNQKVLDLYVDQSDKNLWEIDSMAASILGSSHSLYNEFITFSKEKLTKVQDSPASNNLSAYYNKQVKKTEDELLKIRSEYEQLLKRKDKEAQKKQQEYKQLLIKRQIYRLEKFGFKIDRSGYYNIDKILKDLDTFELTVHVEKGNEYDRAHVYIINPLIKSLFAMISDSGNIVFNHGYAEDQYLLIWKEQNVVAIVVAYKGEQPYYAVQDFSIQKVNNLFLKPSALSMKALKDTLNLYRQYSKENKIIVDLEYQEFFFKEKKRQEQLQKERDFMQTLYMTVFAQCCKSIVADGKVLFESNCKACHCKDEVKVGPALKDISKRRSNAWIKRFTRESQAMIREGDPYAVELYKQYNNTEMTAFPSLTDSEISRIIIYLNSMERGDCSSRK
jgi:cytochrome c2